MSFPVTQAPTVTQVNIENQAAQQSKKGSCGDGCGGCDNGCGAQYLHCLFEPYCSTRYLVHIRLNTVVIRLLGTNLHELSDSDQNAEQLVYPDQENRPI
ncbi:unnamed protein product, partial [Brachionus calyciflorus]